MEMERSSGNMFADIGVAEADNMKVRAELVVEIHRIMQDEGWNQIEAAEHFGVSRPRLNDVRRGRLEKVTVDRLINMLAAAGRHVHIAAERAA